MCPAPTKPLFRTIIQTGLALVLLASAHSQTRAADAVPQWEHSGWGGGGCFYPSVYHPTKRGVIYMGGDVAGVYKTEDNARNWRMINNGLVDYGVFSLAVDRTNPKVVYAATQGGLCKSVDEGESWQLLPNTERNNLRITGEKDKSIRSIAVDPANGNILYAGSPGGGVYKSTDAGLTWKTSYRKNFEADSAGVLRVQFGGVNRQLFGGLWLPVAFPADASAADAVGIGFSFKGNQTTADRVYVNIRSSAGPTYRSRNLNQLFADNQWRDVVLTAQDFALDPEWIQKNPDKVAAAPVAPDWPTINRMDFSCVGPLASETLVAKFGKFFFAVTKSADGKKTGTAASPLLVTFKDFTANKSISGYGNMKAGEPLAGTVYSVAVATKDPSLVAAATEDSGVVISLDAGKTWRELNTPRKASNVVFDPANPNILYASFFFDGVRKSTDKGQTWTNISDGFGKDFEVKEIAVNPVNPLNVYAAYRRGFGGGVMRSVDGGKSWLNVSTLAVDAEGDPTLQDVANGRSSISCPTNVTISPVNPTDMYVSANWRSALSEDGGLSWTGRSRGADISCIHDIRFSGNRTYVAVMDEGTLVSENNGKSWKQLWPLKYTGDFSGHSWRLAVTNIKGQDRIIGTHTPWDMAHASSAVVSMDGGATFKINKTGLPDYTVRPNTMWGRGYPRALAVDPNNPQVVYLGLDGDPADGKMGGGIFKSEDGGNTWNQLPNQPGSRRMFYGLAVDPTNSKRVYWGGCGDRGGVYRSEDGGASWKNVFSKDTWIFNLLVTKDGTLYAGSKQLWRSTDHGTTWEQLTNFPSNSRVICGLETDPRNPKSMWVSHVAMSGSTNPADGAIYRTTDGGVSWKEITGNLPYIAPLILRFNPTTNELWAGGVTLHKLRQ